MSQIYRILKWDLRPAAPYLFAIAAYVAIGVIEPRFLLNSHVGIVFCVATAWGVPTALRRLARRMRRHPAAKPDLAQAGQP